MKKLLFSLLAVISLTACNEVDSDERFVAVESVTPARVIIFEDYTGQECVNCPAAHEVLEQEVALYPENVIPVSIHAGHFGISVRNRRGIVGLMQPEGTSMAERWGIDGYPKGVINHNGTLLKPDDWSAAIREQIAIPTNLGIELEATLSGKDINITTTLKPEADIDGTLYLWVLESGIVAQQKLGNGTTQADYVHNNVYRCAVGEGEAVSLKEHVHTTLTATQPLREEEYETWVPANLTIVAFVETPSGIIQAAKAEVK